jgi:hypothetical protein
VPFAALAESAGAFSGQGACRHRLDRDALYGPFRSHLRRLRGFGLIFFLSNAVCWPRVGMTRNDLRLILLTLGVVVAFYAVFPAFCGLLMWINFPAPEKPIVFATPQHLRCRFFL